MLSNNRPKLVDSLQARINAAIECEFSWSLSGAFELLLGLSILLLSIVHSMNIAI